LGQAAMPTLEPWIRTLNPIAFGSTGLQVPSDFGLVSLSNLKLLGSGRGYPTQVINIIIIIIIIIIIRTTTTTTTTTIDFTFQIKSIFFFSIIIIFILNLIILMNIIVLIIILNLSGPSFYSF
jgi:hypothetical protein